MWTDRQTDVGHINLIGGLVTCKPPNKRETTTAVNENVCEKLKVAIAQLCNELRVCNFIML